MAELGARLPRKRNDGSIALSTLVTGAFFALVLVMAFRPHWLAASVSPEVVEAPALLLVLALLAATIGAMGLFCWARARSERKRGGGRS